MLSLFAIVAATAFLFNNAQGATLVSHRTTDPPLTVVYIEVGWVHFGNIGCYSKSNGRPFIDIGIIFAAWINYNVNTSQPYFAYGDNVATVLGNLDTYVKPLQLRGIKVLLSILGNHQGAGISNFKNPEQAHAFALEVATAVNHFGLDGVDLDDEWSEYGVNDTENPKRYSFLWLLQSLRELLPNKIISFYFYGPATNYLKDGDIVAGTYLDYSWNAIYGSYNPPAVPAMTRSQLAPAAVWVNDTKLTTARTLAKATVTNGYGAYLFYDMPNDDSTAYFTPISELLYDSVTLLEEHCLKPWSPPVGTSATVPRNPERLRKPQTI